MTVELTKPTDEMARRLLEEVPYEQRIMGIKMAAMGGANPTALFSLPQVAGFIQIGEYEELFAAQRGATVGYVGPDLLATWITEVFGDTELASAVTELVATGEVYGRIAMPIRELLRQRLTQCHEILDGVKEEAETAA